MAETTIAVVAGDGETTIEPVTATVTVIGTVPNGPPGQGVPPGGDPDQVLAKVSGDDYDTEWVDGGTGGGAVDSVNGEVGVVVLDAGDVGADVAGAAAVAQAAAIAASQPLDSDLTAIAALSTTAYGRAFLALADAAAARTALALGTAATHATGDFDAVGAAAAAQAASQPIDSDLTAIAALTTTSYGRAFLALADSAAARSALSLGTAAQSNTGDFDASGAAAAAQAASQPLDSDLTAIAALTTTAFGRAFLAFANTAAVLSALSLDADLATFALPASTTITAAAATVLDDASTAAMLTTLGAQPLDSDLTTIAGLTATTDNFIVSVASAWASRTPAQVKATLAIAESDVTNLTTDLAAKAPLASPTFTGTPAAPTAAAATNTTQIATTAFVLANGAPGGLAIYGDGSDGSPTFDGSTTILGMAPSSSVYTMTRDLYLDSPTINNNVTIKTVGFRFFVKGVLTGGGSAALVAFDGSPAVGATAGSINAANPSTIAVSGASGQAGGNGGTANGTSGTSATNSFGGASGAGGHGSGTNTGGTGRSASAPNVGNGALHAGPQAAIGLLQSATNASLVLSGGAGGSGGGGDASNSGGGGGGGGGSMVIVVKTFAGTGAIHARGGAGANGVAGQSGGGGGGGGGWIVIISGSVSAGAVSGWTVDTSGGAAGTKSGASPATDGSAGSAGNVVYIPN